MGAPIKFAARIVLVACVFNFAVAAESQAQEAESQQQEAVSTESVKGPNRNFQVYDPLDFLAAVTAHIPDRREHLVRYYGWYSS